MEDCLGRVKRENTLCFCRFFPEFREVRSRGMENGCLFCRCFCSFRFTLKALNRLETTSNIFVAAGSVTYKKGSSTKPLSPLKFSRFPVRVLLGIKTLLLHHARHIGPIEQVSAGQCGQGNALRRPHRSLTLCFFLTDFSQSAW